MPKPVPMHAKVATRRNHKILARARASGIVPANDEDIAKKINSAVCPGLQGRPA